MTVQGHMQTSQPSHSKHLEPFTGFVMDDAAEETVDGGIFVEDEKLGYAKMRWELCRHFALTPDAKISLV